MTAYIAYSNFTQEYLSSDHDAEKARERAAGLLTYKGSTYRDHLDGVTVVAIPPGNFGVAIDLPLHEAKRRWQVVDVAA